MSTSEESAPFVFPAVQKTPEISDDSSHTNRIVLPFLHALWRSHGFHQIGSLNRHTKLFKNIPVKTVAEAVSKTRFISNSGSDAYIALGTYMTPDNRTAANVSGAYAFWCDIDCGEEKAAAGKGYKTEDDAMTALQGFCKRVCLPMPTFVVSSGGGLHIYWVLDSFIRREKWLAYATKLRGLTRALGFLADDTRTADIASVLRMPGTLNQKYKPARQVLLKQALREYIGQSTFFDAIDSAHLQLCNVTRQPEITSSPRLHSPNEIIAQLNTILKHIDPDCGYEDWLFVLMAIHHTTGGSETGFRLADRWSSRGKDYKGTKEIRAKWNSFKSRSGNPITIATLVKMAKEKGMKSATEQKNLPVKESNSLDRYSLRGKSEKIAKQTLEEVLFLDSLAILGQLTVFFAAPNTGKTLLTLWMLIEAINKNLINSSQIYYVNVDDTAKGIFEKLQLADEYGFHMLAEGYEDFDASILLNLIEELIEKDQASGVVIILDTLKKFTNLMDKNSASGFTKVARRFSTKGGTIVALAHVNKNLGQDGKVIPAGTSDIKDDFDCAYTLSQISSEDERKIVQFENIKRRGNVDQTAAYSYTIEQDVSYNEILSTIQPVNDTEIVPIKQAAAIKSDSEAITAVTACINDGIKTKMKLADAVSKRAEISKRSALNVIERYTGSDPVLHRWTFEVRERGAKVFVLLDQPVTENSTDLPDTQV